MANSVENISYCIYKHTSPSGKVYIGQTNDIKRRWKNNGEEYLHCPVFYNAIKKYGWDNFLHEIIVDNLTKEEANEKEKYYITQYNSTNNEYGYNISIGGTGGNQKEVYRINMYDMQCNLLQTFDSAADAARFVNTDRTHITKCCKKKQKSASGYRWAYADEGLDLEYINSNLKKTNNARSHSIKITDIETNIEQSFHSIQDALNYYNFNRGGFMYCLHTNKPFPKLYLKRYLIDEV